MLSTTCPNRFKTAGGLDWVGFNRVRHCAKQFKIGVMVRHGETSYGLLFGRKIHFLLAEVLKPAETQWNWARKVQTELAGSNRVWRDGSEERFHISGFPAVMYGAAVHATLTCQFVLNLW